MRTQWSTVNGSARIDLETAGLNLDHLEMESRQVKLDLTNHCEEWSMGTTVSEKRLHVTIDYEMCARVLGVQTALTVPYR